MGLFTEGSNLGYEEPYRSGGKIDLDKDKIEFQDLVDSKEAILKQQVELATKFYGVEDQDPGARKLRRAITEQMTNNAFDLVLPQLIEKAKTGELEEIALVLPLRGALAMATPNTIRFLKKRLSQLGQSEMPISIWTQGLKRNGEKETAEMYSESGYLHRTDFEGVHPIFLDWGMATGSTVAFGAQRIKEETGIGYGNMTSIAMTMADKARCRLSEICSDETGTITLQASTNANLNEVGYIHQIQQVGSNDWIDVNPTDWGDAMFGMTGENQNIAKRNIQDFVRMFDMLRSVEGVTVDISDSDVSTLEEHYRNTCLATV